MKNLFITKSRECRSDLFKGHTSKLYKRTGIHLLLINCKVTSSEANRPTFPNMALAERQKDFLAWSREHSNNRDRTIKTLKYMISSIQGIMAPVDIDIAAQVMLLLGPIHMRLPISLPL